MYTKDTLDNRIRVVTEYIPYVNSVSVGVWIANGSRDENLINNGISHFIEHMMFKGTDKRSAKDIAESIEEIGGQINAFTGKESTCYYVKVLDSHLDIAIDVLSDMLLNSIMNDSDIEREKGVILEEINMYEDSPEDLSTDLLSKAMWPDSSVGYPILGNQDTLKSFDSRIIKEYINNNYVADNTVISIVGNFDINKVMSLISEKFAEWNVTKRDVSYDAPEIKKSVLTKYKDIEQVHLSLGLKGLEMGNDDVYTLLAINNIFGGGTSSRLFQKIREEKGYAYSIYSYPSSYRNIGYFSIYVGMNPSYVKDVISLIQDEIEEIKVKGVSETELKKSKEQLKGNYILGLESTSNRMFGIGKSELLLGKINEPKEILDKIDAITHEDAKRIIKTVFENGIISSAAVGKIDKKMNIEGLLL
ncbi:protease 3 precursor [Oxobacter pfennigii]|uniref:Protease 3 n=1 Tax=Oxobacter pfennigii TaxID=36849 RepID=A0A0P8YW22_9CLOT|nr:pitrilysin family protein [Oxobacter pfennigii]KPU43895.1 protease 3 precursor [Oxobacter pfennigii]